MNPKTPSDASLPLPLFPRCSLSHKTANGLVCEHSALWGAEALLHITLTVGAAYNQEPVRYVKEAETKATFTHRCQQHHCCICGKYRGHPWHDHLIYCLVEAAQVAVLQLKEQPCVSE